MTGRTGHICKITLKIEDQIYLLQRNPVLKVGKRFHLYWINVLSSPTAVNEGGLFPLYFVAFGSLNEQRPVFFSFVFIFVIMVYDVIFILFSILSVNPCQFWWVYFTFLQPNTSFRIGKLKWWLYSSSLWTYLYCIQDHIVQRYDEISLRSKLV